MSDRREDIIFEKLQGESDGWETRYSMEEVKFAMDEYMKACCLELIQWMLNKGLFASRVVEGQKMLYYRGEYITKETLFENFL